MVSRESVAGEDFRITSSCLWDGHNQKLFQVSMEYMQKKRIIYSKRLQKASNQEIPTGLKVI